MTLPFCSLFDHVSFRVDRYSVTLMGKVSLPAFKSGAGNLVKKVEAWPLSSNDDRLHLAS